MCVQTLQSSGRSWSGEFPPDCDYSETYVSTFPIHFTVGVFSFTRCVGVSQLASRFLPEGVALRADLDSVYPEGNVSSGASFVTILD